MEPISETNPVGIFDNLFHYINFFLSYNAEHKICLLQLICLVLLFPCVTASNYNYSLSRNIFYPLAAGAWNNPNECANKAGFKLIPPPYEFEVPCSLEHNPVVKCYAYIAINEASSTVMVAFRGTQCFNSTACPEFQEEERNFTLSPFVVGNIDIFFKEATMNLYKNYHMVLQNYKNFTSLWLSGHSLGGAEATATAVYILNQTGWNWAPNDITIYTYGCPRVGDEIFASFLDDNYENYFRVIHGFDPIPHAPTRFQGYYAAAKEIWYFCPMFPTSPYATCESFGLGVELGNLSSCSDVNEELILENAYALSDYHLVYYELDITKFADDGCCGCEPTWVQSSEFRCDCYQLYDTPKNWADANLDCSLKNVPSTLTTIGSAFENADINTIAKQIHPRCPQFFIGLNDLTGNWTWAGDQTIFKLEIRSAWQFYEQMRRIKCGGWVLECCGLQHAELLYMIQTVRKSYSRSKQSHGRVDHVKRIEHTQQHYQGGSR